MCCTAGIHVPRVVASNVSKCARVSQDKKQRWIRGGGMLSLSKYMQNQMPKSVKRLCAAFGCNRKNYNFDPPGVRGQKPP